MSAPLPIHATAARQSNTRTIKILFERFNKIKHTA
jgi:hypothetical protein